MTQEEKVTPINAGREKGETRQRSTIQFPYADLENAITIAEAIYKNVGMGDCDDAQLAAWTGQSIKSSGFRLQLTASKMFGVIDSDNGRYKLSQLGKRIVDPKLAREAKATAFLNVPLYKAVFENYNGNQLPPASGLENDMVSLGVAEKVKDRARQTLERSAQQAGFFEYGKGRLVMPSVQKMDTPEDDGASDDAPPPPPLPPATPKRDFHPFIDGLLEELPNRGQSWSKEDQQKWLDTAKSIFGLIYKDQE